MLRASRQSGTDGAVPRPTAVPAALRHADVLDTAQTVDVRDVSAAQGLGLQMDSRH